jgi:predicted GNAT superfamily acetyltransferase
LNAVPFAELPVRDGAPGVRATRGGFRSLPARHCDSSEDELSFEKRALIYMAVSIREATPADANAVLTLNADSVHFLSPLDAARLRLLAAGTCYYRVAEEAGEVVGFLMAFPEGADYDSPNYRWFAARFDRFVYVDRVVIREELRGTGLGSAFYRELEGRARAAGVPWLTCEVYAEPPNPVSLAFHDKHGFVEIGRQPFGSGGKVVSMRAKSLPGAD